MGSGWIAMSCMTVLTRHSSSTFFPPVCKVLRSKTHISRSQFTSATLPTPETNRYPAFALFITSPTTLYHMNRGTIQRTVDFRQWAPVVDTFRTLAKHAWDAPEGKRTYERIAVDSSNGGDSSRVSRRTSVSGISAMESVGCGMSKRARSSELALSRDVVMARGGKRSVPRSKSNGADADWLHRVLTV